MLSVLHGFGIETVPAAKRGHASRYSPNRFPSAQRELQGAVFDGCRFLFTGFMRKDVPLQETNEWRLGVRALIVNKNVCGLPSSGC